jgi:hypothetical protein
MMGTRHRCQCMDQTCASDEPSNQWVIVWHRIASFEYKHGFNCTYIPLPRARCISNYSTLPCVHSTALSIRGAANLIAVMPAIMHRHLEPPSSWRAFFCGGGTDSSCSSEAGQGEGRQGLWEASKQHARAGCVDTNQSPVPPQQQQQQPACRRDLPYRVSRLQNRPGPHGTFTFNFC